MRAYTNGGHQDSVYKGYLPGFFEVWYNPQSMLNILSMKDVRKKYRITMDMQQSMYTREEGKCLCLGK